METSVTRPLKQRREQKFFRFELQPGDRVLLDRLSAEQRNVLLTSGSYKDRAEKLNIPVGTVRSRLHRARSALEELRNGQPPVDSRVTHLN